MTGKSITITLLLITTLLLALWVKSSQSLGRAPDEIFTTITGKKIELKKLHGKPVLITFWATDCAICIKEIPHLIELYQQFHPQGLEIIAVAMYYDPPNHVLFMSQAKQIPYTIALDLKGHHAQAFGRIQYTPTTFLISPTGDIVMKKTGILDRGNIQQQIKEFVTSA
ncbi:MAG: TlpA family protein disulfide reductase [Methylococcales symbiont of Hymedesmia sp. n. MRB-2018]|nr:MAG: TlpA family protein disulfide reductase [Methylococcales symbiont of Hymedesmia sp. n. MRB-2018]